VEGLAPSDSLLRLALAALVALLPLLALLPLSLLHK